MATKQSIVDFILDQLKDAGEARARKMFGEYALYLDDKVVALVCNDRLFVKNTSAGRAYAGKLYREGYAYPGAKASFLVSEELLEDRDWLTGLIRLTADALPLPKPKKSRKTKSR